MKRPRVLLCLALFIPCALGGVRPITLTELCLNSTRIVRGSVVAEQVRWEGSMIVTDWLIEPQENLKGTGNTPVLVKVPGGSLAVR